MREMQKILCLALLCLAGAEAFLSPSLPIRHARSVASPAAVKCQLWDGGIEPSPSNVDRRAALLGGGLLLGAALGGPALPAVAADLENLNIKVPAGRAPNVVITGCNSGIGRDAAAKLAASGYNVILACRTQAKAEDTKASIAQELSAVKKPLPREPVLTAMECDLASLSSVREFAGKLRAMSVPIDILVLNAGLSLSTGAKPPPPRTKEGFELTVGTNHLGHFLLCNLLLKDIIANPSGARIVVTASQVHDPTSPGGNVGSKATLGDMSGLEKGGGWDMVDGGAFDGDKAYKDSKLCNVLFTRELSKRLIASGAKGVTVNCFSPGLITKSGLFRNQGSIFVPVFDFIVNNVARVGETVGFGGDCLVTMAVGEALEGKDGEFWANTKPGKHTFEVEKISTEASDDAKASRLWRLSAKATGLKAGDSPFSS